jgi:prepilin-type N-terminal cleavage/methylation domain-containing protein
MRRAFTLVELLVSMLLLSMAAATLVSVLTVTLRIWTPVRGRADIVEDGSQSIDMITRDLSIAHTVTAATASTITITADVTGDSIDDTVSYSLSGTVLQRTLNGVAQNLARNAQAVAFTYRNTSNIVFVPITQADRDTIRVVTIVLTMTQADETTTFGSSAYCRNQGVA